MLKGLGNLAGMMKQAQEMGGKLQAMSDELKQKRVTGVAGGGMVRVEASGAGEVLSVHIEQQLFDDGDRDLVEELVPAAVNQALEKARQLHAESMQSLTAGINLPGLDSALSQLGQGNG